MYSAEEREDFERTGIKPGRYVDHPAAGGKRRRMRTARGRLMALAIVLAILAVIGPVTFGAMGSPQWYTYTRSALSILAAGLFFTVARVRRPVSFLVPAAIAAAVLRLVWDVSAFAVLSTSWTATVIYAFALPAAVTVYMIVAVLLVAREQTMVRMSSGDA